MARYKLKLKRLDFVSPVDTPAQETARVLLIKRRSLSGYARAVKVSDELGLVFCWAFTSKSDGASYYDLQGDNIDEDFIKAAAEFMQRGGATDEMHDGEPDGRVVFAMPMTSEIAKAFGIETDTTGLMVALKPSAEVLAKFKSGEYTGVSIEGIGERERVKRASTDSGGDDADDTTSAYKCSKCAGSMNAGETACSKCGGEPMGMKRAPDDYPSSQGFFDRETDAVWSELGLAEPIVCVSLGKRAPIRYDAEARGTVLKSTWTTATIDDLPDSSFLYIEGGGKKDDQGKTTPRSLRHFPYKDENGKIDLPHLRDAIARIPQSSLPATLRNKLQAKAEKLLGKQHTKRLRKQVVLTSVVDGHQHAIDLDDPADWCGDRLSTTYASSEGAEYGHCHVWIFDPQSGAVTIAMDSGHDHTVEQVVPPTVLAMFRISEQAEAAQDSQELLQQVLDGDAGAAALNVTIAARNSTRPEPVKHADLTSKETAVDELKKQLAEAVAKIARLEKKNTLTDAQRAYYGELPDRAAKDAFLAKSHGERDGALKGAIVYTAKSGKAYYDAGRAELAKQLDDQGELLAKATARTAQVEFEKRAETEIGYIAKSVEVRAAMLRAIDGIADEPTRKAAHEALKAANGWAATVLKMSEHRLPEGVVLPERGEAGGGGSNADANPVLKAVSDLEKRVKEYQTEHKIPTYEQAYAKACATDPKARELYAAIRSN